jgi:DNA-directed RNA polymerase specialized sigma24 family protein
MNSKTTHPRRYDGLTADKKHRILREVYRNYLTFKQFVSDTGKDVIEYSVPASPDSDEMVRITISFVDLERALKKLKDGSIAENTILSQRKEQAFLLNVILDKRQEDVAAIMGITTVSVGQYVEQSVLQLAKYYFGEMSEEDIKTEDTEG